MQKNLNCINITWIRASILPNITDCYLGLTPQQPCVIKRPNGRFEPWPIETVLGARSGATSDQVDTHENAFQLGLVRMQKYKTQFEWHSFQLSTQMQFNGARECKSISISMST